MPSLLFQSRKQWVSPYINHFASADTVAPDYINPQDLNLYSYVLNNPLRYTDPTGHRTCESYGGYDSCLSEKQITSLIKGEQKVTRHKDNDKNNVGGSKPMLKAAALPPSPFACAWVDCALSAVSLIASAFTLSEVPEVVVPAFIVDLVATGIAINHTNNDRQQGKISTVNQYALNITGVAGLIPGPPGVGFSVINVMVTFSGYPH